MYSESGMHREDCKSPEALASMLPWSRREVSFAKLGSTHVCVVYGIRMHCVLGGEIVRNGSVNGNPNLSDLLGRATALAVGRISGLKQPIIIRSDCYKSRLGQYHPSRLVLTMPLSEDRPELTVWICGMDIAATVSETARG